MPRASGSAFDITHRNEIRHRPILHHEAGSTKSTKAWPRAPQWGREVEETIVPKAFKWCCFVYSFGQCLNWIFKKGKEPAHPAPWAVLGQSVGLFSPCWDFSLLGQSVGFSPPYWDFSLLGQSVGFFPCAGFFPVVVFSPGQFLIQASQSARSISAEPPAPTLTARLSERLASLAAKLFSKSDPYLGALQEAEVFRNLAARILGMLGQERAVTALGARPVPGQKWHGKGSFCLCRAGLAPAQPLQESRGHYSHQWAAGQCPITQPGMIHSSDTPTCHPAPKIYHQAQSPLKARMAWVDFLLFFKVQLSWTKLAEWLQSSQCFPKEKKKKKKKATCVCSSGWTCCPFPIPHLAAQTSGEGQVQAFQREQINLDPGQVKDISHSYIFNKVDLFLLLPRKLVLRCTQNNYILWNSKLLQMPQNSSSPKSGPEFQMFCRCLWFAAKLLSSYPHNTAFSEGFWHTVIHLLCTGVAFQKYFVFLQKTAGILL